MEVAITIHHIAYTVVIGLALVASTCDKLPNCSASHKVSSVDARSVICTAGESRVWSGCMLKVRWKPACIRRRAILRFKRLKGDSPGSYTLRLSDHFDGRDCYRNGTCLARSKPDSNQRQKPVYASTSRHCEPHKEKI